MNEIGCILCPVDFSEATPFGLNAAESLAKRFSLPLELLHVLPHIPLPLRPPVDPEDVYERWDAEVRGRLEALARETRKRGIPTTTKLARGAPVPQIQETAEQDNAGLIVMPTHGRAGWDRLLHGSVAEGVVRSAQVPTLTVPPAVDGLMPFEPCKILVATDFSDAAAVAFETACNLARCYVAELVITHVFTFSQIGEHGAEWLLPTFTKDQVKAAMAEVTRRLEQLAGRAQKLGLSVGTDVSQGASPAAEIIRVAEEEQADLIVVASHGEGIFKRALLGSTTAKLARSSPKPLFTVPAIEAPEAPQGLAALAPAEC